jgi:DNA modification methylase
MRSYYEADGITIYHGDCRDVIKNLPKFDLMATDPPYGIGEAAGKNKSRSKLASSFDYGNAGWDNKTIDFMDDLIGVAKFAAVFGGNYYKLPPSSCWLVWDKENGNTDFADCELAWTNYTKAVRIKRHRWHGMIRKNREERWHPTQKPVEVMSWVISLCPGTPETVLDPLMGSGTTLVAAKNLGRKAIGIEINERYCEIAAERLSQGVLPI